eukprot:3648153-Amphidinium_carterae.2
MEQTIRQACPQENQNVVWISDDREGGKTQSADAHELFAYLVNSVLRDPIGRVGRIYDLRTLGTMLLQGVFLDVLIGCELRPFVVMSRHPRYSDFGKHVCDKVWHSCVRKVFNACRTHGLMAGG